MAGRASCKSLARKGLFSQRRPFCATYLIASNKLTGQSGQAACSFSAVKLYVSTSRRYSQAPAPQIVRGRSKLFPSADDAVADLRSGSTILSAGFGLCGVAETLIQAITRRGAENLHSLTAVSNNAGVAKVGGLALLVDARQVSRLIISFLGNNKSLEQKYLTGEVAIELCPQGTIAERVRAGGAGIPAFYTPTGVSTLLEEGQIPVRLSNGGKVLEYGRKREVREFKGRKFLMEEAITGDVAILRAWKADEAGNCVFRYLITPFMAGGDDHKMTTAILITNSWV